ncbi:MAG: (Fe-S)-binding protein, partial [Gammaproteobacteria bacterium]|nr:(Fe-S)-binding protein [Gammaproteobacteria bacterium]
NNYFDMQENTIRKETVCCGGGGGLLTDDLLDLRKKGASPRMKALSNAREEHGVTHMAAICAICKSQFAKVMPGYDFEIDSILSVHQMVSNAIIMTGATNPDEDEEDDG